MLLGGFEFVIGKFVLGKLFAGAAAKTVAAAAVKTGVGLAAKAELVHHAVHVADAIGNAVDATNVVDASASFSSSASASPLSSPPVGVGQNVLRDGLAGGIDDLGGGAYPRRFPT